MNNTYNIIGSLAVALSIVALPSYVIGAPDRAQFIRECLDPAGTSETPRFDDYTAGSYHIDKLDVVQGIEEAAKAHAGRLRAVIIFGPNGPLWTYHLLVALSEGKAVRLNALVMPHARITGKGTATLSSADFERFLNKLVTSELLTNGEPTSIKVDEKLSREFAYDMLVATWTSGRRSMRFGEIERLIDKGGPKAKEAEATLEHLNRTLKSIKATYPDQKEKQDAPSKK